MEKQKKIFKVSMATLAVLSGVASINALTSITPVYATKTKTATQSQFIDGTTSWKYLDTNVDPGTSDNRYAWTVANFDDSAWKSEVGKFGYKNGALSDLGGGYTPTVLLQQYINGTKGDVIPTYFFRTTINVESLDNLNKLTGTLAYDDAAIIYINGTRVAAFDEPEGGYASNMTYGGSNASAPKTGEISLSKDDLKDILKVGKNTIAVEIHQGRASSSDMYFEFKDLSLSYGDDTVEQKALNLTVGEDESEMNLTWYANSNQGEVQFAKASAMKNGEFPEKYTTVKAESNLSNDGAFVSHQATLKDLDENTKYVYRIVNDKTVSEVYNFTTKDFDGSFNFIFAGDPQIGTGNVASDTEGWDKTLNYSIQKFQPNFIMSGGDQVNTASNETEYKGYLDHEEMTSVPQSPSIGNHDSGSTSYSQHFNLPNVSTSGKTTAGSDYYYVYNNTLFLNINTNNTSTAEHKTFLKEAIDANQDVRWKVVTFHHSIYSVASHSVEESILNRRNELVPVFDELGIDVVLMGHDHVYVRSHIMKDLKVTTDTSMVDTVTDPDGILYLTANSASGSKYYDIKTNINMDFVAKKDQSKKRSISNIEVSENEFKITTYLNNGNDWDVLDEFTIQKTAQTNEEETTLTPSTQTDILTSLKAPAGSLLKGTTLETNLLISGTLFTQIQSLMKDKSFKILDLSLMKDETETDLLGDVELSFTLPKDYSSENLELYRVKDNNTKTRSAIELEKIEFKTTDNKIVISTDTLGQFVFVDTIENQEDDKDDTVQTPDQSDKDTNSPDQGKGDSSSTPNIVDKAVKTEDQTEIIAYGILALSTVSCAYVMTRNKKRKE